VSGSTSLFGDYCSSLCRAMSMLATLRLIREKFGGPEGYVIEKCGLTREEVEKIRKNLIVEKPAVHIKVPHSL
jgi:hypothetical protein